ncbi:hypothetical protein C1H46_025219 [Malus baccata]|uniref:Uncharacterized protein n=1 Tax=Malus baccata TaxID=106549 RepID=A0A540LS61_MALBA|nr:hypothetical protein C1H46_025219 [Malus baccata]
MPPPPTAAATAPAEMHPRLANLLDPVDPVRPRVWSSPASTMCGHRHLRTIDTTSASTTDALGSQLAKKNTRGPCHQLKTAKVTRETNRRITIEYDDRHRAAPTAKQHSTLAHDIGHTNDNFNDINDDMLAYVNRLFAEQYKQWKSNLHQYFETFDDPQVALEEGCPKEFEDQEDNWVWLCNHFQEPGYAKKAKANNRNWEKKTLLHHSGSRLFSYRMEARQQGGSKFPEIDIFNNVYVRPGDELAKSLHSQVTALKAKVADLRIELASYKSQMSQIVHALNQSDIRFRDLRPPSTYEPFQPKHAHNSAPLTSKPVPNLETFQPPLNDDPVGYVALFS